MSLGLAPAALATLHWPLVLSQSRSALLRAACRAGPYLRAKEGGSPPDLHACPQELGQSFSQTGD